MAEIENVDPLTTGEATYGEDIKGSSTVGVSDEGAAPQDTPGYAVADNGDESEQDGVAEGRVEGEATDDQSEASAPVAGEDGVAADESEDEGRVDSEL